MSDNKIFKLTKSVERFVGMINWYDGPKYDTLYTLVSAEEEGPSEEVQVKYLYPEFVSMPVQISNNTHSE